MKDQQPRLGVAPLVWDGKRYLLGQRGRGPHAGKYVIPGGGVELGETWLDAGRREVREETGIEIAIVERCAPYVMEIIGDGHRVCLVPLAMEVGGKLTPSEEIPALAFYTPREIAEMHVRGEISPPVVGALRFWNVLCDPEERSNAWTIPAREDCAGCAKVARHPGEGYACMIHDRP